MAILEAATNYTRLRCEVAIPSGLRQGRAFALLRQAEPGVLELLPVQDPGTMTHQIINVWGMPLVTYSNESDPGLSGDMAWAGFWEYAESMALLSLVRPGMTVVDAGATLGYYSVLLAHALTSAGQVYAFEPEPRNAQVVTANALLLRQMAPQTAPISVYTCGLSDQEREVRLNIQDRHSGMHSFVHGFKQAVSMEMVAVNRLDMLRESNIPPVLPRRIDLIKADVRGSELALLKGAQRTLRNDRPVVCVRFEPSLIGNESAIAIVELLRDCGYAAFRMFNATLTDAYRSLVEAVPIWNADGVIDQVHRKLIVPNATLLSFPDAEPAPSVR